MHTYYEEIQSEEAHLSATQIAEHYEVFTLKGQPHSRLMSRLCEHAEKEAGALPIFLKMPASQKRVFRYAHFFKAAERANTIRKNEPDNEHYYIKLDGQGYYFT